MGKGNAAETIDHAKFSLLYKALCAVTLPVLQGGQKVFERWPQKLADCRQQSGFWDVPQFLSFFCCEARASAPLHHHPDYVNAKYGERYEM